MSNCTNNRAGSTWHRWEPHIHVPGTLQNDQYGKSDLSEFCAALAACAPKVRALGVTDYCSLASYEAALEAKRAGQLPEVEFLFPNVELRLDVGTVQGAAVNLHLLFCPDDPNHVSEIKRFLARLTFRYKDQKYGCTVEDLKSLGRSHDPKQRDERGALKEGVRQFKVSFAELCDELKGSPWAQENMLMAVAASRYDGTSGMRTPDHAFDALRTTIESACNFIFTGNPKDIEFWCGKGAMAAAELAAKYGSLKPCIHGSDAHCMDKVGKPEGDRFTWIKGDVCFESLRQACIEPEARVHVGRSAPRGGAAGHTITRLSVTNAPWMVPSEIPINPGLVTIIGARGSGKTALADFIAVGASSMSAHANSRSFVTRAREFLGQSMARLDWESGEQSSGELASFEREEPWNYPQVQYLSQQFVDDLCTSEGMGGRLHEEIKRVMFNCHDELDRLGASNFDELYELSCRETLSSRIRNESELSRVTDLFLEQLNLRLGTGEVQKNLEEAEKQLALDTDARNRLAPKGQEERVAQHQRVQTALLKRKLALDAEQKKLRGVAALQADLADFRKRVAPAFVAGLRGSRSETGLSDKDWQAFVPEISRSADELVESKGAEARKAVADLLGAAVAVPEGEAAAASLLPAGSDLDGLPVNLLESEGKRLSALIGVDRANAQKYAGLSTRIQLGQKKIEGLKAHLLKCSKAGEEMAKLKAQRRDTYRDVFADFCTLQEALESLYAPLRTSLDGQSGTLGKLRFAVRRKADAAKWAEAGEGLLDLRREGPFKGRGTLLAAAVSELCPAWERGTPAEADAAVDAFIDKYGDDLKKHRPEQMPMAEWGARIWEWLLSTKHIAVTYGLQYDGIDVERLSPGTRGIVLLLLYLAVDTEDQRPLIIDQPEENLDPQSVFDELVGRFREARERRQIIVVTHNANLVVNTDADQVIVASAGQHQPGQLPEIRYESGGLESPFIRRNVCEILEGGEEAFRARAKRLRVRLG